MTRKHNETWCKEMAASLRDNANLLKQRINQYFWVEEGGFLGLATDRDDQGKLRLMRILTSNTGQALSPFLFGDDQGEEAVRRREAIIQNLFSERMLNVSGIRTLATDEYYFRPGAYHNGLVWGWDTRFIAERLEQLGYYGLANELDRRVLSQIQTLNMYPENVLGNFARQPEIARRHIVVHDQRINRTYNAEEPSQSMQGWMIAAAYAIERKSRLALPEYAIAENKKRLEGRILDKAA